MFILFLESAFSISLEKLVGFVWNEIGSIDQTGKNQRVGRIENTHSWSR
jgi:hypothetical protein